MDLGSNIAIIKAAINGEVVKIDLASEHRNAYKNLEDSIEYLGSGTYHSYNNTPAKDITPHYFWRYKQELPLEQSNLIEVIRQLTESKDMFFKAYKTSCDQFIVMTKEIIKLRNEKQNLIDLAEQLNDPSKHGRPPIEEVDTILAQYKKNINN